MLSEKENKRKEIIERLKSLNSVYGIAARSKMNEEQEEELIKVCYYDGEIPSFQEHLGKELFKEIVKYVTANSKL
jgi:hypothetical protein